MSNKDEPLDIKIEVPELKEMLPDASELKKQLEDCQKKAQENWEIALRSRAELDNVQKRATRDIEHAHKYSLEGFVKSLLPIVDSLERGLEVSANTDEAMQNLRHGMELTLKMLLDALAKYHVEQVNPVDAIFDPTHHEALTTQPSETVPDHSVINVVQKGYILHGRLLRPAQVIVSKGKS